MPRVSMLRLAESFLAKCRVFCFKHSYRCEWTPVGPEGPLTFLTGGFGSYLSERLKLQKDDVQGIFYSSIAGAFALLWFTRDWISWSH